MDTEVSYYLDALEHPISFFQSLKDTKASHVIIPIIRRKTRAPGFKKRLYILFSILNNIKVIVNEDNNILYQILLSKVLH